MIKALQNGHESNWILQVTFKTFAPLLFFSPELVSNQTQTGRNRSQLKKKNKWAISEMQIFWLMLKDFIFYRHTSF